MNGLIALTIIMLVYGLGDIVATKTKAIISMLFVASVVFAVCFWMGMPGTIFQDSMINQFASVTVGLLLVHMGTTIKLADFAKEWKTVVLVLCSTIAICLGVYFVGQLVIQREMALIGAPILGGGVVAFIVMSDALQQAGENVILFGSIVLVAQGVIGFPIASILCRKEATRLQGLIKTGDLKLSVVEDTPETKPAWRFIPQIPEKYNSPNLRIGKLALAACLAQYLTGLTGGKVNTLVICLILGIIGREIGFYEEGELTKANGFTFVIGAVLTNVFASLANTTPAIILQMLAPLAVVAVIGLACCALVSIVIGKVLGISWYMSFACGVTALFGFPGTFIVPDEVSKSVGDNQEETAIIMQNLMPKMVIGGMVSVSIISVLFAGVMAGWA